MDEKGKCLVGDIRVRSIAKLPNADGRWKPPKEGWIKINVELWMVLSIAMGCQPSCGDPK